MKKMKLSLLFCVSLFSTISHADRCNKPQPVEWCVRVCVHDYFKDFKTEGQFLGGSGNTMDGIQQGDAWSVIFNHCSNVYKESCFKTHENKLHNRGAEFAHNKRQNC